MLSENLRGVAMESTGRVETWRENAVENSLGPNLDDNAGHTEWYDGPVDQSEFTTTFSPNTRCPYTTGGNTYDADFNSRYEGTSATQTTYASITARSYHVGGVHAGLMDGSTRFFSENIDQTLCRKLGTRAGKEIVSLV